MKAPLNGLNLQAPFSATRPENPSRQRSNCKSAKNDRPDMFNFNAALPGILLQRPIWDQGEKAYFVNPEWWIIPQEALEGDVLQLRRQGRKVELEKIHVDLSVKDFVAECRLEATASSFAGLQNLTLNVSGTTALEEFIIRSGKRHIRAVIAPAGQAERIYSIARRRGHQALLVKRDSFREMSIALSAQGPLNITCRWLTLATPEEGRMLIELPPLAAPGSRSEASLKFRFDGGI